MDTTTIIIIVIALAAGYYFFFMKGFKPLSVEDRWKFSIQDNSDKWNVPCLKCGAENLIGTVKEKIGY